MGAASSLRKREVRNTVLWSQILAEEMALKTFYLCEVAVKIDFNETGLEVMDCTGLDSFSPAWVSWRKAVTKLPHSQ